MEKTTNNKITKIQVTDIIKDFANDEEYNNYYNFMSYDKVLREDSKSYHESIKNFILYYYGEVFYEYENITNDDDLQELKEFAKGQTGYIQDSLTEKADGLIDIYYSDIYASVSKFQEWINEAKREFGCSEELDKEIQQGQYLFYSEVLNVINDLFMEYLNNYEDYGELKEGFKE